jgi:hypothetical protein
MKAVKFKGIVSYLGNSARLDLSFLRSRIIVDECNLKLKLHDSLLCMMFEVFFGVTFLLSGCDTQNAICVINTGDRYSFNSVVNEISM